MVKWSDKVNGLVERLKNLSNGIVPELTISRSGDITDIATSLPLIEVLAYPTLNDPKSVSGRRLIGTRIDYFISATSAETPSKTFDCVADVFYEFLNLLDKIGDSIEIINVFPVVFLNKDGEINNTEVATIGLETKMNL